MSEKKLIWCPIDIPKFPYPDFDLPTSSTRWQFWDFKKITKSVESNDDPDHLIQNAIAEIESIIYEEYPDLIEWINLFPFKTIRNIKFNTQIEDCLAHIDFSYENCKTDADKELWNNNSINEPCGYRTLISGSKTNMQYAIHNGEKIYTTIPDDTDTFVLNSTTLLHGVDAEPGRKLIYMHFEIDTSANEKLIQSSLEKYSDYAIYG